MTAMTSDDRSRPLPLRPRRWFGLLFWSAMILFFAWLWSRSHQWSDVAAAYTRSGNINGVLSHRGHLLLAISTLSLGPEKALTVEHVAAPVADGDWLFAGTSTRASKVGGRYGFGYALSKPGDLQVKDATWSAIVVPHWAAIAGCSLALLWHVWRFTLRARERRWRRQGRCIACSYDLRGCHADRCPECGTLVLPAAAADS